MMKTTLVAAALSIGMAAPAFAAKVTIEFVPDDGSPAAAWTFDDATMTATAPDGTTGPYTWDEEAGTLCGTDPDGNEVCATFTDTSMAPAVGVSSAYTMSAGPGGTATITAIEE